MKTKIFTSKEVKKSALLIKKGELVAFPTETVYGLGVNALDSEAAKKVFLAKGRPSDNPLIIHISEKKELDEIAIISPAKKELVDKIIQKFWPGPLTIILKKRDRIPKSVTGGLNTVAIRMPKNKIALDLIRFSGVPIAAPSANLSGKPSGTCFEHVFEDFDGKIAGIIRSKNCEVGLESTVVDLTTKRPILLRSGAISFEALKKVLPDIEKYSCNMTKKVKSPGMKYRHYSPDAKVILFETSANHKISLYEKKFKIQNKKVKVIISQKTKNFAKNLFKIFRQCDKDKVDYILISSTDERGLGLAIMNRIRKASLEVVV